MLKRIFGPKRGKIIGHFGELRNEELHNLYSTLNIIRMKKSRRTRWAGHVSRTGEKMNTYRVLVGKTEGKKPVERYRRRWEDNIKIIVEI
jgi:hypothetical protein